MTRMTKKQAFELTNLVAKDYSASGATDTDFGKAASVTLGFEVSRQQVRDAREIVGIEANFERGGVLAKGAPKDCATKEDVDVILVAIEELTAAVRNALASLKCPH